MLRPSKQKVPEADLAMPFKDFFRLRIAVRLGFLLFIALGRICLDTVTYVLGLIEGMTHSSLWCTHIMQFRISRLYNRDQNQALYSVYWQLTGAMKT